MFSVLRFAVFYSSITCSSSNTFARRWKYIFWFQSWYVLACCCKATMIFAVFCVVPSRFETIHRLVWHILEGMLEEWLEYTTCDYQKRSQFKIIRFEPFMFLILWVTQHCNMHVGWRSKMLRRKKQCWWATTTRRLVEGSSYRKISLWTKEFCKPLWHWCVMYSRCFCCLFNLLVEDGWVLQRYGRFHWERSIRFEGSTLSYHEDWRNTEWAQQRS